MMCVAARPNVPLERVINMSDGSFVRREFAQRIQQMKLVPPCRHLIMHKGLDRWILRVM